jgi:hypothetical protein
LISEVYFITDILTQSASINYAIIAGRQNGIEAQINKHFMPAVTTKSCLNSLPLFDAGALEWTTITRIFI